MHSIILGDEKKVFMETFFYNMGYNYRNVVFAAKHCEMLIIIFF